MISFKEAKDFSLQKWEWLAENPLGKDEDADVYYKRFCVANPELKDLACLCGFCERYYHLPCRRCELANSEADACEIGPHSLFRLWEKAVTGGKSERAIKLARKMVDIIAGLEEKVDG